MIPYTIYPSARISDRTVLEIGDNSVIGDFVLISVPYIKIGKSVNINAGTKIIGNGRVVLEDFVSITYDVKLITSSDSVDARYMGDRCPESDRKIITGNITIKEGAYLGSNVVVMPSTTIGEYAVIGAGAYISKHIAPYTVVLPKQQLLFHKRDNTSLRE